MEKNAKAYSFLISALITAFSFILMVAIVVNVFSNSIKMAHHSENKTIALNLAQKKMEALKTDIENMSSAELSRLAAGTASHEEAVVVSWDGEERHFTAVHTLSREAYTNGVLVTVYLEIYGENLRHEKESFVTLTTAIYKNRGNEWER